MSYGRYTALILHDGNEYFLPFSISEMQVQNSQNWNYQHFSAQIDTSKADIPKSNWNSLEK